MAGAERHLARWRAAGLIGEAQERRIIAYEAGTAGHRTMVSDERPGIVEALIYLGVAIVLAGIVALTSQHWQGLGSAGRLATVGIPGILALVAGALMRRMHEPALVRAAGVLWLVAVALAAGTAGVAGSEQSWSAESVALSASVAAAMMAGVLWPLNRSRSQLLGLTGSAFFLCEAIAAQWHHPYHAEIAGILILIGGIAGLLLTERDVLTPTDTAVWLASFLCVAAPLQVQLSNDAAWTGLPVLLVGAALMGVSVRRGRIAYLLAGVLALFFGLTTYIFQHFEHTIGAPAALLLSGCLLIAGVIAVATWRRRLTGPPKAAIPATAT